MNHPGHADRRRNSVVFANDPDDLFNSRDAFGETKDGGEGEGEGEGKSECDDEGEGEGEGDDDDDDDDDTDDDSDEDAEDAATNPPDPPRAMKASSTQPFGSMPRYHVGSCGASGFVCTVATCITFTVQARASISLNPHHIHPHPHLSYHSYPQSFSLPPLPSL